jgi:hypothetical protein
MPDSANSLRHALDEVRKLDRVERDQWDAEQAKRIERMTVALQSRATN